MADDRKGDSNKLKEEVEKKRRTKAGDDDHDDVDDGSALISSSPPPPPSSSSSSSSSSPLHFVWWIASSIVTGIVFIPLSVIIWFPVIALLLVKLVLYRVGVFDSKKIEVQVPRFAQKRPRLFFDGTGHMFPFSLGATAVIMQDYEIDPNACLFAISGGNFSALCVIANLEPGVMLKRQESSLKQLATAPLMGLFGNLKELRESLDRTFPSNIHTLASGRLAVVMSSWPFLGFKYKHHFSSKEDLISSVVASCSFPFLVWRPQWFGCSSCSVSACDGLWFDAGLQNALTPLDPIMDLSIRVFKRYDGDPSLTPGGTRPTLLTTATPMPRKEALRVMRSGSDTAIRYVMSV